MIMSLTDQNLKELNGIKIITQEEAEKKQFKYCSVSREYGIHEIEYSENFYMFHHFETDSGYGWNTIKVSKV